jgi:hypothetical protein
VLVGKLPEEHPEKEKRLPLLVSVFPPCRVVRCTNRRELYAKGGNDNKMTLEKSVVRKASVGTRFPDDDDDIRIREKVAVARVGVPPRRVVRYTNWRELYARGGDGNKMSLLPPSLRKSVVRKAPEHIFRTTTTTSVRPFKRRSRQSLTHLPLAFHAPAPRPAET